MQVTKPSTPRKSDAIRFILLTLLAFCILYQPPLPISIIYVLTFVSFVYMLLFARKKIGAYLVLVIPFLSMFLYFWVSSIVNKTPISAFSHYFWLFAGIIPACMMFSSLTSNENKNFHYLFRVLFTAALIQALLAFLCLFFESFQTKIFEYMLRTGLYTPAHLEKWGHRIYGYGNSLMYAIPVTQALISAWAVTYGIMHKRIWYSIGGILILFSAIINAKIAIFIFLVAMTVGFLVELRKKPMYFFKLAILTLIFLFLVSFGLDYIAQNNPKLSAWLSLLADNTALSEIYGDYYTDISKWELPSGLQVIFGTGQARNKMGYDVDMGIVNDIWIGGLIYFIFTVGMVWFLTQLIRKKHLLGSTWSKILAYSFFLSFFLADMKGVAFHYSSFMALFVLVALFGYREPIKTEEREQ